MKVYLKIVPILILLLILSSCSLYTIYNYKYAEKLGYGVEQDEELIGKLLFSCPTDMIYERVTDTKFESVYKPINERKMQEVDRYIKFKDRILVPKGTKGVYYDDKESLEEDNGDWESYYVKILVDFGDSIIIPFTAYYRIDKDLPGDFVSNHKENSKSLTKIDRHNLRDWKNSNFTSDRKFFLPPECNSGECVEYEVKGWKYGYLKCKNWKKYDVKTKSIHQEVINERRAKGKTKHIY